MNRLFPMQQTGLSGVPYSGGDEPIVGEVIVEVVEAFLKSLGMNGVKAARHRLSPRRGMQSVMASCELAPPPPWCRKKGR